MTCRRSVAEDTKQDHVINVQKKICHGAVVVVDEEGGVSLRLDEAQARDMADKTIEPRPRCLTEAVKRAREEADVVGLLGCRLYTCSCKLPWRKALETSSWCAGQCCVATIVRTVRIVAGLTTGENVSPKSMPGRWLNPRTTHRAL